MSAPDRDLLAPRRRWSYARIARVPYPPPQFGSEAWLALDDMDPAKIAGCVLAAEAWAREADDLEDRLRREVAESRQTFLELDDEQHRAVVEPLTRASNVVPFAERRRRQRDGAAPRVGDYPGRHGDVS